MTEETKKSVTSQYEDLVNLFNKENQTVEIDGKNCIIFMNPSPVCLTEENKKMRLAIGFIAYNGNEKEDIFTNEIYISIVKIKKENAENILKEVKQELQKQKLGIN